MISCRLLSIIYATIVIQCKKHVGITEVSHPLIIGKRKVRAQGSAHPVLSLGEGITVGCVWQVGGRSGGDAGRLQLEQVIRREGFATISRWQLRGIASQRNPAHRHSCHCPCSRWDSSWMSSSRQDRPTLSARLPTQSRPMADSRRTKAAQDNSLPRSPRMRRIFLLYLHHLRLRRLSRRRLRSGGTATTLSSLLRCCCCYCYCFRCLEG